MFKRKGLKQYSKQELADELKERTGAKKILLADAPEDNFYGVVNDVFDFITAQHFKGRRKEDLELQSTLLQHLIKEID